MEVLLILSACAGCIFAACFCDLKARGFMGGLRLFISLPLIVPAALVACYRAD
jgi:hypothetical protein